jgi:hypothetical protein
MYICEDCFATQYKNSTVYRMSGVFVPALHIHRSPLGVKDKQSRAVYRRSSSLSDVEQARVKNARKTIDKQLHYQLKY